MKIGIFGTFDIRNWGDLLFPLIAQKFLEQRIEGVEVVANSYRPKTTEDWYYPVTSLVDLPDLIRQYDAILIGGGHVVRFDKLIAYGDYFPLDERVHHPTGYWLLPALLAANEGIPVIWNGPSTASGLPEWAGPMLGSALQLSDYVAVRDEVSKEEFERFAPEKEIHVIPDTAYGIDQLVDKATPSDAFQVLRKTYGLEENYVLLQASARTTEFRAPVERARELLPNHQFVEISIGPDIGDELGGYKDWGLKNLITIEDWPSPPVLAELICHASGIIGTSLHLSLTSMAFGHPVLRPVEKASSKYIPLLAHRLIHSMSRKKAETAESFVEHVKSGDAGDPQMEKVRGQLDSHWAKVAAAIQAPRKKPLGHTDQFLLELPGYLETNGLPFMPPMEASDASAPTVEEKVEESPTQESAGFFSKLMGKKR